MADNPVTRIVVADDEPHIVELISCILEEAGAYEVHVAENGRRAIELIDRLRPDLALLDYMMPCANGLEVLDHIRRHRPDTAAIVVSGRATKHLAETFRRAGAAATLAKPFAADDLVARIESTLCRRSDAPRTAGGQ